MAALHELNTPISQNMLAGLREPLNNLQGNILKGHGRDRSVHIFLEFTADTTLVKQWISKLATNITSAQQQLDWAKQYRDYRIPGPVFLSFFLSASGYRYLLGLTAQDDLDFDDEAFVHGMEAAQHRLNDPPKETWEQAYRNNIHAMVILADDDESALLRAAQGLIIGVGAYAKVCAVEQGRVMRNAQGDSIEHFGYADSQSQPLFFQDDIDRATQKENRPKLWDVGAGPDSVLVPDPYGRKGYDCGSYLVFRKLEQHVRAYKERERELANALGLSGEDAKRAGALVVGRFEDGTPIIRQPTAGRPTNNFTYDEDPDGEKCPLQAHIRKVNPREESLLRIVRRGITYGERWKEPKDNPSLEELPSEGVGLFFMCYQKSIVQQFEFLQLTWANNPTFPIKHAPGIDPVIGRPGGSGVGQQRWPAQWNDPREKHEPFDFHGFVTHKGGEYFFAPSIFSLLDIENMGKKG